MLRWGLTHAAFALSGAALALAYPPFGLWPLAWFALVPVLAFAMEPNPRHLATASTLMGVVWSALMLSWLWIIFGPLAILLWALIGALLAVAVGIIAQARKIWGEGVALALAAPVWLGVDFFRSEVWSLKFSWLSLGYSQHGFDGLIQLASWVGVYGLTFLMVAFSALTALALKRGRWMWIAPAAFAALFLALSALWPTYHGAEPGVRVAAAQLEYPAKAVLLDTARQMLRNKPDLIVFPEYCARGQIVELHELARANGATLVYGAKILGDVPALNNFYSSAIVVAPEGVVEIQEKSVPVPLMLDGQPAPDRKPRSRLGVAICYDMDFTFVSNELVAEGAQLLVYPTMDHSSWGEKQRRQHAMVTPFRAVEHRRWVVRCASAGVSQIVDPGGRVIATLGTEAVGGILQGRVALSEERTIYASVGWILPWLCLGLTAGVLVLGVAVQIRSKVRRAAPEH